MDKSFSTNGPCPKVSVCIDVHNYADFLPEAIESVLRQTLADFELIIVDDCSTDESFAVAQSYERQDSRIITIRNANNLGMVKNRNVCLRAARGEYVKFVHADDFLCSPEALNKMVALMESNPAISVVASAMQSVDAHSKAAGVTSYFSSKRLLAGTTVINRCLLEQKNLIGGPSAVLFRRRLAARGFDERYFHSADLEMWFHLLEQGCFGFIEEPLTAYRWHPRQQTEKDRSTLTQANDQRALLATYLGKPYVRARRWIKSYLLHDAVRQIIRRSRKLGLKANAQAAITEYGKARYYKNYLRWFAWRKLGKYSRLVTNRSLPPAQPYVPETPPRPSGLNVAGFIKGEYGIGESSRAICRAVTDSGLPHVFINIHSKNHRNQDESFAEFAEQNPYRVNLMTFSFDYARRFYKDQGRRFFAGRYNIALWYWELEKFPARWHSNFDYYDEIWVPTRFCQEAIAAVSPIPVRKITYPFYLDDAPVRNRARFSLEESSYIFLFNFDYWSTIERKNPLAVIEAFKQAFSPDEDVVLVLKSINAEHDPRAREVVRQAAAGWNVRCIEPHLTGTEMNTLFASIDCYISLHRSEGLGLGMAQAMALGKPVIATGYSGNLEFMNAENSLLVDYDLVELQENYGPYEKGSFWAEPRVEHAASLMRRVYTQREESAQLGERARAAIRSTLDPLRTRNEIVTRIREI